MLSKKKTFKCILSKAKNDKQKSRLDVGFFHSFVNQHPDVARSNRFMIEKMNTAESRQSVTSTPQTIQSGIPVPQMRAMTLVS